MQEKPLILVTNDDGITAPGIRALIKIMNKIGDVVVVAPDSPQSRCYMHISVMKKINKLFEKNNCKKVKKKSEKKV